MKPSVSRCQEVGQRVCLLLSDNIFGPQANSEQTSCTQVVDDDLISTEIQTYGLKGARNNIPQLSNNSCNVFYVRYVMHLAQSIRLKQDKRLVLVQLVLIHDLQLLTPTHKAPLCTCMRAIHELTHEASRRHKMLRADTLATVWVVPEITVHFNPKPRAFPNHDWLFFWGYHDSVKSSVC